MWIRNGMILTPDGTLRPGHIRLHENRIASVCFPDEPNNTENDGVIDADGAIVSPGLIDIHIHGAMGADVYDGTVEALDTIAGWLVQNGVTSFLASTMTVSEESLLTSCRAVCRHMEPRRTHCTSCDGSLLPQATLRGVRLEGPFLSAARVGAQNPDYLRLPDPAFLRRLSKACGNAVRIVDVAPELPGASDLIRSLAGSPIRVSLGHTAAAYDQAMAGFRAGAAHVTH
ncbi:MAG: amidohydrolase family protein, partial [Firmicutes bacterium]|nr:amidohydrolase family protein [Bacillota bacterium]